MASPVGAAKAKTDIKIIILGDSNVGKTCLLQRYMTGEFSDTLASIGASLAMKKWEDWNVALWDTAGEEKYASLSSFYCRGAQVAILTYDLTNKKSLERLQKTFIPLLEEQAGTSMIVVVGTKLDLVPNKGREVGLSDGQTLAREQHQRQLARALAQNSNSFLNAIDPKDLYFETSSKTGEGVSELFDYMQRILLAQLRKTSTPDGSQKRVRTGSKMGKPCENVIRLDDAPGPPPSSQQSGCCKN